MLVPALSLIPVTAGELSIYVRASSTLEAPSCSRARDCNVLFSYSGADPAHRVF